MDGHQVKFLCNMKIKKAHKSNIDDNLKGKGINELHTKLVHPLDEITCAMEKAVNLQLTGMFKTCEYCTLDKRKKARISKTAVSNLT